MIKIEDEDVRVLVVDDERDIRDGSERILTRMGCRVFKASRGEEGLDILKKEDIAIVLLDMKMPGLDGMEVLQRIREGYPSILVVVITGFATVETAIEAMKQGAYDFIPKPFEPDQVRIVVNRAWEKIRLSRQKALLEEERRRTLADLDTEKSRIHTILKSLPIGTLVTNSTGQVVLINPAFKELLKLPKETAAGKKLDAYIQDSGLCDLVMEISRGQHIDFDDIPEYEFSTSGGKYFVAIGRPVLGERRQCLGAVVSLTDISAIKVLDRLKSEFVAKVSHELRSPLSTIHEQIAFVLRDMVEAIPESDTQILTRAKEKTYSLISLISDLLDLSRIEEGDICAEKKPVRIDEQLKDIVAFLSARSDAKHQTLRLDVRQDSLPAIKADPIALESIFGNLITNAITYSPEGGTITVSVDMAGINIRVQVADNGFGIEPKDTEKIFERFYRVKNDKTRFITGTGLGLPIVKELVDSLGGMIELESEPGHGSKFTVLIPTISGS